MFTKEYVKQVLEETCGQYMQVTDEIAQQVFDGFTVIRSGAAVEHQMQRTVCTACGAELTESNVYCPTCGLWNPNNRR